MQRSILGLRVFVCLLAASSLFAQQAGSARQQSAATSRAITAAEPASPAAIGISPQQQAAVPRLIKFNGTLRDLAGKPIVGPADVTFALYTDEAGGPPLWFETQTVQASSLGRYTVLLGAMTPAGIPMELFTSGEAHWLGLRYVHDYIPMKHWNDALFKHHFYLSKLEINNSSILKQA